VLIHRTSSRPGLHRVAHAVEAGEVSADLLTDLRAEICRGRERPPADRHAFAVQELAERFDVPVDRLTELLAALEAQPSVTRELFLPRSWRRGSKNSERNTGPENTEADNGQGVGREASGCRWKKWSPAKRSIWKLC